MSVIFLAGVHGVGKGFLGAPAAKSLGMDHLTASQLIQQEKGRATWSEDKRVAEVDDNQLALIRAITRLHVSEKRILLDGHFVLRDTSGNLTKLPSDIFAQLHIAGAIVLTEEAEIISHRIAGRDGVQANIEAIVELAAEEALHAENVCRQLQIPLTIIHSPDKVALMDAVAELLKNKRF